MVYDTYSYRVFVRMYSDILLAKLKTMVYGRYIELIDGAYKTN